MRFFGPMLVSIYLLYLCSNGLALVFITVPRQQLVIKAILRQYWNIRQAFQYHCEYCTDIASKSETVIIIFKYQGKIVPILFLNLAVDAHSSNLVHRTFSFIVFKHKFDNFFLKMSFFLLKLLEYCANIAPKSETVNTLFKYQDKIAAILFLNLGIDAYI